MFNISTHCFSFFYIRLVVIAICHAWYCQCFIYLRMVGNACMLETKMQSLFKLQCKMHEETKK
jgi:hypothetical protein